MRLICPNCGAQYEISDDAIPEDGRDVQCSNCGHTWFQTSANASIERDTDEDLIADEVDLSPPEDDAELTEEDLEDVDEPQPMPERRPLPEDVQAVLQEEATYEETARKAEAEALEYQQDLGLSGAAQESPRDVQARERMARLRGLDPDGPESAPEPPEEPSRKEMLPYFEQINSTLRGGVEHASVPLSDAVEEPVNHSRRGFRGGFGLALIIAAALTLAYVYASQISAAMPGIADMLAGYVAQGEQLRSSIDNQLKSAVDTMNSEEG